MTPKPAERGTMPDDTPSPSGWSWQAIAAVLVAGVGLALLSVLDAMPEPDLGQVWQPTYRPLLLRSAAAAMALAWFGAWTWRFFLRLATRSAEH